MASGSETGPIDDEWSRSDRYVRSAYIHVPFCRHRCGYCDFTLIAGRDELIGSYLRALEIEFTQSRDRLPFEVDTLFLGGGTPTHPPAESLARLLQLIKERVPLAQNAEFATEANPRDLDEERLTVLERAGVNRLSLGVQSFDAAVLSTLERDHAPEEMPPLMKRLRPRWANVAIDLIFGVPGQSLVSWKETLQRAIDLEPAHISTYGLTFEENTAFYTRRLRGELKPIAEELERDQYAMSMEMLTKAGFEQYEISNFARPGFACRHNQVYWKGLPFHGFGPGAARYLNGVRETNVRSVLGWLSRLEQGASPTGDREQLSPFAAAKERIYLNLRRREGVVFEEFRLGTGFRFEAIAGPLIQRFTECGWLACDGQSAQLTPEGRFFADSISAEFLAIEATSERRTAHQESPRN